MPGDLFRSRIHGRLRAAIVFVSPAAAGSAILFALAGCAESPPDC